MVNKSPTPTLPSTSIRGSSSNSTGYLTVTDQAERMACHSDPPQIRRLNPIRFLVGLLLTTLGVSSILLVGVSLIHVRRVSQEFALPMVGLSVLLGVMLLGGGFGLMATAAAGFDEAEFDRLMSRRTQDNMAVTPGSSSCGSSLVSVENGPAVGSASKVNEVGLPLKENHA